MTIKAQSISALRRAADGADVTVADAGGGYDHDEITAVMVADYDRTVLVHMAGVRRPWVVARWVENAAQWQADAGPYGMAFARRLRDLRTLSGVRTYRSAADAYRSAQS